MYKALDTDAIKSKNKDDFDTFQDTSCTMWQPMWMIIIKK